MKREYVKNSTSPKVLSINSNSFLDSNVNEYFSTLQYSRLTSLLKELSEKSDIKDQKKIEEFHRGKLILLLSVFTSQRNFHTDMNTKKAFNNVVELIKQFAGENKYTFVNILEDFYALLPKSELKLDLTSIILEVIPTEEGLFRSNRGRLEEVLSDLIDADFGKEVAFKVYAALSKVLETNKSFDVMERLGEKIGAQIATNLAEASKRPEVLKLYFFILLNKLSTKNFNTNFATLKSSFSSLTNESKLVEAIVNNNIQGVSNFDAAYFTNTYGSGKLN